jgi:integrase
LPLQHPLKHKYRNGRMVQTLGACGHREAVLRGTVKRAEILGGLSLVLNDATQAIQRPVAASNTLRQIYGKWASSKPRSADSQAACLRAVVLFEEFTDCCPLEQITRAHGDGFRAWLQHADRETTSKTARDRLTWVKSLLNFACRDSRVIDRNPWEGINITSRTTNKRRPWSGTELTTLFAQPLHTTYTLPHDNKAGGAAAYWIPLLGLFTGARVGELAQLRVEDVESVGGIAVLSITDEGENQSIKTAAGIRKVPIHSELLTLGFLEYVASVRLRREARLWPDLPARKEKPGGYFSHWFGIYRRSLSLGKYPDFHCFRHTVRSQLAELELPESIIDSLLGHEVKGSTGAKVYTHRSMNTLKNAIEQLSYPTLKVPRLSVWVGEAR